MLSRCIYESCSQLYVAQYNTVRRACFLLNGWTNWDKEGLSYWIRNLISMEVAYYHLGKLAEIVYNNTGEITFVVYFVCVRFIWSPVTASDDDDDDDDDDVWTLSCHQQRRGDGFHFWKLKPIPSTWIISNGQQETTSLFVNLNCMAVYEKMTPLLTYHLCKQTRGHKLMSDVSLDLKSNWVSP